MVLDRNNFSLRTITTSHVEDLVGGSVSPHDLRHLGHVSFSFHNSRKSHYLLVHPGDGRDRMYVSTYEDRSLLMQLAVNLEKRGLLLAECDFTPGGMIALPKISGELYTSTRAYSVSRAKNGVYVAESKAKLDAAAYSPA